MKSEEALDGRLCIATEILPVRSKSKLVAVDWLLVAMVDEVNGAHGAPLPAGKRANPIPHGSARVLRHLCHHDF